MPKNKKYNYIYGPVSSWRLGSSLGVDAISAKDKACAFNCIYCQIGPAGCLTNTRKIFVPANKIMKEINSLPFVDIDYVTFSGTGEPTLAKNIGLLIKLLKKTKNKKIAVLTNSALLGSRSVQKDLLKADFVIAKLDAPSQDIFEKINRPKDNLKLESILKGIKDFRQRYKGKFALQIMFVRDNLNCAKDIAAIVTDIDPDEVQLNTPLRPSGAKPLSKNVMARVKRYFKGANVVSVYDARKKRARPLDSSATFRRRGKCV